jgi:flagellar hook-associated protein 2
MAITSAGIGSNLDVNGIVSQLMNLERQPVAALDTKEANYQAKLSAYGSIKGALSAFQSSALSLASMSKFQVFKATSSDASVLSASASSIAVAGSYSIDVAQVAESQKLAAAGKATLNTVIGTGTITFTFGGIAYNPEEGDTFIDGVYSGAEFSAGSNVRTVDIEDGTLEGIRDAINAADIGVSAEIINDGDPDNPYRLILSSETVGAAGSLMISTSGSDELANFLSHDPAGTQNLMETTTASDALLTVNGVAIQKTSNTITDVIKGVTLTLKEVGGSTLAVTQDTESARASIETFVNAYNDLRQTLADLSSYDPEEQTVGLLQGESAVLAMQRQLKSVFNEGMTGVGISFVGLSQIGIAFQRDGSLTVDSTRLSAAMEEDYAGVANLFAATGETGVPSSQGVARRLDSLIGDMLDFDGLLTNRTDGISDSLRLLDKRRDDLERRMEQIEQRYRSQFASLDSLVGQMMQTSNYLTQQLAGLSKSS